MTIGWVLRDDKGIVVAFSAVAHTDPATLDEFAADGTPELVEAERIVLNRPLPDGSRVLMQHR